MSNILIVEDSGIVAIDMAYMIEHAGYNVVGPCSSVTEALALLRHKIVDAAILDINLGVENSERIANELLKRDIPLAFLSGYDSQEVMPPEYHSFPCLQKPISERMLLTIITKLLDNNHSDEVVL